MEIQIKKLLNEGKSMSEIGIILDRHRTTISKIVKANGWKREIVKNINCVVCNENLGINKKNNTKCMTCVTKLRRLRLKIKCVEYLGGKCVNCGFDKHLAALQFHHRNSNNKDFLISSINTKSWKLIIEELNKCDLLCANCHAVKHSTNYDDENLRKFL